MAQSVASWFGAGAAHHNYYMWMGGNHVKNHAGSSIANYYADGVNYHADGLPHEPKRTHLQRLHNILAQHNRALMQSDIQIGNEQYIIPVGSTTVNNQTFAYVYKANDTSNDQLIFILNMANKDYTLPFNGSNYDVPANSVSLIDNTGKEIYNTAKVNSTGLATERVNTILYDNLDFVSYSEPLPLNGENANIRPDEGILNESPLEQIRLSNDTFEYLIYSTNITFNNDLSNEAYLQFTGQAANAYIIYINDQYIGQTFDYEHTSKTLQFKVEMNDSLDAGQYTLSVISSSLGIDNYEGIQAGDSPDECDKKGLTGNISIIDGNDKMDLIDNEWMHYIGLTGERLDIYGDGMNKVEWNNATQMNQGMIWYKTTFETPSENVLDSGVVLIDIGEDSIGVNRGHFYLNGYDMGHYNNYQISNIMVQQFYFIPKDYLNANGQNNTLVFINEYPNATLSNIKIVSSTVVIPA